MDDPELTQAVDAMMRWLEGMGGENGEELAASSAFVEAEVEEIWLAGWQAGRAALLASIPTDLAANLDHYLYGLPKRAP